MHQKFAVYLETLDPKLLELVGMEPYTVPTLPSPIPDRGVYLFSEGDEHLYVGRSNNLRSRLQTHCRPSSQQNNAPFAFRLARAETGQLIPSYQTDGSRDQLMNDPEFKEAFETAKNRIKQMDVRVVEEEEPVRQYLLELYAAIVLDTPHNDFDNH